MPKRIAQDKEYNDKLRKIGMLFQEKRWSISNESRESFIENRNELLFNSVNENSDWISLRYLINIETGKNLPSIESLSSYLLRWKLIPVELFDDIYKYCITKNKSHTYTLAAYTGSLAIKRSMFSRPLAFARSPTATALRYSVHFQASFRPDTQWLPLRNGQARSDSRVSFRR